MNIIVNVSNKINEKITNFFTKPEKKYKVNKQNVSADDRKIIYQKHRRAKVNNHIAYHYYTAKDRQYFKTPKGKRPIKITATEAICIIQYLHTGFSIEDIYEAIDFHHTITIGTLKQWITQYEKGLMDLSLTWICKNHIDNINVDENVIRKNKR